MEDPQPKQPLPPLTPDALDGYREEAAIARDQPLPHGCNHKGVRIISSTEIRCSCGAGFTGADILTLYNLLKTAS